MTRKKQVRGGGDEGRAMACRGEAGRAREHPLFIRVGGRLAELMEISTGHAAERTFDAMSCPVPADDIAEWKPPVAPGHWIACSLYGTLAFEPLRSLYVARASRHGVELPEARSLVPTWISDAESARSLLWGMGLRGIRIYAEQLSYRVSSATEWWEIVSNSVVGRTATQLPIAELDRLKAEHLAEVAALARDTPLWIHVPTFFAMGYRPQV